MGDQHNAAATAEARIGQTRRTLLAGGAAMAIGLPLMSLATARAQGAARVSRLPPQLAGGSMPKVIIHVPDNT